MSIYAFFFYWVRVFIELVRFAFVVIWGKKSPNAASYSEDTPRDISRCPVAPLARDHN